MMQFDVGVAFFEFVPVEYDLAIQAVIADIADVASDARGWCCF